MDRAATVDGDYGCRGSSVCPSGAGRPCSAHGYHPNIADESETGYARTAKSTRPATLASSSANTEASFRTPPPSTPKLNLLRRRLLVPTTPSNTSMVAILDAWSKTRTPRRLEEYVFSQPSTTLCLRVPERYPKQQELVTLNRVIVIDPRSSS